MKNNSFKEQQHNTRNVVPPLPAQHICCTFWAAFVGYPYRVVRSFACCLKWVLGVLQLQYHQSVHKVNCALH